MSLSLKPSWLENGFCRQEKHCHSEESNLSYRHHRRQLFWEEEDPRVHYSPQEYDDFLEGVEWEEIHYWKEQAIFSAKTHGQSEFDNYYAFAKKNSWQFTINRVEIEYEDPWGWDNQDGASEYNSDNDNLSDNDSGISDAELED
jgi:hypothetical protein